jgi:hypothetical protein
MKLMRNFRGSPETLLVCQLDNGESVNKEFKSLPLSSRTIFLRELGNERLPSLLGPLRRDSVKLKKTRNQTRSQS